MEYVSLHSEFVVTSLMPSGSRNTMRLKRVADVDLLVQSLVGKAAMEIQVIERGGEPESYETWRAKRSETRPQGPPIEALLRDVTV